MGVQASSADYASSRISYSYRLQGAREWKLLGDYDVLSKTGFNPFAVDPATNSAIGLKRIGGARFWYACRSTERDARDTVRPPSG